MEKDISVLVLDDEKYVIKLIDREFRDEAFGFMSTTNPDEAMAILSEKNIKVVISDQQMPKITGIEFLKNIKEKYPDIIRILFSGYSDLQVAENAVTIGQIYRYVSKPWEIGSLWPLVSQSIEYYDLMAENRSLFDSVQRENKALAALNRSLEGMVTIQKEFASIVSHELRTPLASIKATLALVLKETAGKLNDDQKNFLKKAKNNVDRLNRLINDILDLSRLDSEQIRLKKVSYDLKGLIDDVLGIQVNAAKQKNLNLISELPDDIPLMFIDTDKIHRVMNNLINNAIKFTEQGDITISCAIRQDKGFVEICIKDTGFGVQEKNIDKLFQKFKQFGELKTRIGGAGLGLAICQEIIHLHGGKIWVESEYGKGSQFYFSLPIHEGGSNANK